MDELDDGMRVARGVLVGMVLSLAGFWLPLALYLVNR